MDARTDQPLYQRIEDDLFSAIVRGSMPAGSRLPSLRQLARDLGVSRITVEAAYEALQARGLVEPRARSGTFVAPRVGTATAGARKNALPPAWQSRIAPRPNAVRERMMALVLKGDGAADAIDFAWGGGDPRLFPVDAFRAIIGRILRRECGAALGADFTQGNTALRAAFAAYLRKLDIPASAQSVLVTAGSQQAIDLTVGALVRRGERVVVEDPTWPGALGALEAAGAVIEGVPLDEHGMRLDALEAALARGPVSLIYTIPTFHNPTGALMPLARRRELIALARRHGVPLLEDDAVREVRFGGTVPPPLAALDPDNVVYVGSFTKAVLPAVRLGYFVAPPALLEWAVARKRSMDMYCSPLLQRAMAAYLQSGEAARHWKRINRIYALRQRAMLEALGRHFPAGAAWHRVPGGPVSWVRLPAGVSARALAARAAEAGVPFAAGEALFASPNDQPYMRLNFSALDEIQIEGGIAKLGALLRATISPEEKP